MADADGPSELRSILGLPTVDDIESLLTNGLTFDMAAMSHSLDENWNDSPSDEEDEDEMVDLFEGVPRIPKAFAGDDPLGEYHKIPFPQAWSSMKTVKGEPHIRKTVVKEGERERTQEQCFVTVLFAGYLDGQDTPLTFTKKNAPKMYHLEEDSLLLGLQIAIKTMKVGEKAKFMIDYPLMYGELGHSPLIPEKAMWLFHVILLSANVKCDSGYLVSHSNSRRWEGVSEIIEKLFKDGCCFMQSSRFYDAEKLLKKAMHLLENASLADYSEEKQQTNFLRCVYKKLMVCYNEINLPKKSCIMWNQLKKISPVKDPNLIREHAKSLISLGKFDEAEQKLQKSLCHNKDHKGLKEELDMLRKKMEIVDSIHSATEYISKRNSTDEPEPGASVIDDPKEPLETPAGVGVTDEFIIEVQNVCESFMNDKSKSCLRYDIPPGLAEDEIESIKLIIISYGLTVVDEENSKITYFNVKKNT